MSSSQKGLCPLCRACVQVKNFKRHWHTQHERYERKRTYDEVFNTLKSNISDQDKSTTTPSIHTFFEAKKRRMSEDVQTGSVETITHESSDESSASRINSNIPVTNINNDNLDDEDRMLILLQIFEDIFVRLENEEFIIYTNFVMDGGNDNVLVNDTITNIDNLHPIEDENVNENDNRRLSIDSIVNIFNHGGSPNEIISDSEMCCSSSILPINRPPCVKKSLSGVQFITDRELKDVDQQRLSRKDDVWLPSSTVGKAKPSHTWFTDKRSIWLRAVCSENKYGLLCVICAQEAKCESRLKKNKGTFISHPYWKLQHKGLAGIANN